jgi:hypothetical protein
MRYHFRLGPLQGCVKNDITYNYTMYSLQRTTVKGDGTSVALLPPYAVSNVRIPKLTMKVLVQFNTFIHHDQ